VIKKTDKARQSKSIVNYITVYERVVQQIPPGLGLSRGFEVLELDRYSRPTCNKLCSSSWREWALCMVRVEEGREFRFRVDLYSQESTFPLVVHALRTATQCWINNVADVANATGLRPQGVRGPTEVEKMFSARQ